MTLLLLENNMSLEQGFLIKKDSGKIVVNMRKTDSILTNQLQVDLLESYSKYFKGCLLDAGCGEKPYSLIYNDLVDSAIGIDVKTCVHKQEYVDVFSSVEKMPFEDKSFDTVLCTNVMEHVPDMECAFKEIARVTKTGGQIILSVPFLYPVHEAPYDFYRYTKYGITHQMEKNGFRVIESATWGGVGLMVIVYFNMFFCKLIKLRCVNISFSLLQKLFYPFYKKFFFTRIREDRSSISKIITCGNMIIAKKVV